MDDDGDIDLLSASHGDDKIAVYINDGDENFSEHLLSSTADGANFVLTVDIDQDGDIDVLATAFYDDHVIFFENFNDESFSEGIAVSNVDGITSIAVADLDNDGDLDIASASTYDDDVLWLENDGAENFSIHAVSNEADGATSVVVADIDGDSDVDLISASREDNKIAWYKNVPNGSLPVELSSFSGVKSGNSITLKWQTAGETNSAGFEIQQLTGADYTKIGFVQAKGSMTTGASYRFNVTGFEAGKYSFRLKQIDVNGSTSYSEILEIDLSLPAIYSLSQNYPNPFAGVSTISYTLPAVSNVRLVIYNQLGQKVMTMVNAVQAGGTYELSWDGKDQNGVSLASGVYLYRLETNKFVETRKMILVR